MSTSLMSTYHFIGWELGRRAQVQHFPIPTSGLCTFHGSFPTGSPSKSHTSFPIIIKINTSTKVTWINFDDLALHWYWVGFRVTWLLSSFRKLYSLYFDTSHNTKGTILTVTNSLFVMRSKSKSCTFWLLSWNFQCVTLHLWRAASMQFNTR